MSPQYTAIQFNQEFACKAISELGIDQYQNYNIVPHWLLKFFCCFIGLCVIFFVSLTTVYKLQGFFYIISLKRHIATSSAHSCTSGAGCQLLIIILCRRISFVWFRSFLSSCGKQLSFMLPCISLGYRFIATCDHSINRIFPKNAQIAYFSA